MKQEELEQLIDSIIDRKIKLPEQQTFSEHLKECPECKKVIRKVIKEYDEEEDEDIDNLFEDKEDEEEEDEL